MAADAFARAREAAIDRLVRERVRAADDRVRVAVRPTPMLDMLPGQTSFRSTIEKPAAGGRMIARVDGQVVLVGGAIPGERVQARDRARRQGRRVCRDASTSTSRQPIGATPFADPLCGGCLYAHIAYPRQLEIKAQVIADAFARIGRLTLPAPVAVAASPEDGYRMRARLHVRGRRLGFFREGTHDVCDARATRQLLPATCDALERLAAALRSLGARRGPRDRAVREHRRVRARRAPRRRRARSTPRRSSGWPATDGSDRPRLGVRRRPAARTSTDTLTIGEQRRCTLRRHVLAFFQGNRYLLARPRRARRRAGARWRRRCSILRRRRAVRGRAPRSRAAPRRPPSKAIACAADDLHANAAAAGGAVDARCTSRSRASCRDLARRQPAVRRRRRSSIRRGPACRARRWTASLRLDAPRADLRVVRRRHARARRAPARRRRLRDRARRRVRSVPEHAARRDGGGVRQVTSQAVRIVRTVRDVASTSCIVSAPLRGSLRTAGGTRRCARSSPGATARRGRSAPPDPRSPRSRRRAPSRDTRKPGGERLSPPDDAGCSPRTSRRRSGARASASRAASPSRSRLRARASYGWCGGTGRLCSSAPGTCDGMSCTSVPPQATFSTWTPRQIAKIGSSRCARRGNQRDLELVAARLDFDDRRMRRFAVARRRDVVAAGEQQPVDARRAPRRRASTRRAMRDLAADVQDRLPVVFELPARRDANERP